MLHEASAQGEAADRLYARIRAAHPSYVDCTLRQGMAKERRGQLAEAAAMYSEALKDATRSDHRVTAQSLLGNLHVAQGEWEAAEKAFMHILKTENANDAYAKLALGNIAYARAQEREKSKGASSAPAKGASATDASKHFASVLKADPSNRFATNGLGVCLASWRFLREAKELFAAAKDAGADPSFTSNLGHCYVALGQHEQAITMYQLCLDAIQGKSQMHSQAHDVSATHVYMARAFYIVGDMAKAKSHLTKAISLNPNNHQLWYNLALTLEEHAITHLQKYQTDRQFSLVPLLCAELEHSMRIFKSLEACGVTYLATKAKAHAKFCLDSRGSAEHHLRNALQKQEEAARVELASTQKMASVKAEAAQRGEDAKALKVAEQQAVEALAVQKRQELENLKSEWQLEGLNDVEVDDEGLAEPGGVPKTKKDKKEKKKRKRKEAKEEAVEEEAGGDDEGLVEAGGMPFDLAPPKRAKKAKREEYDAEEEEEEEEEVEEEEGVAEEEADAEVEVAQEEVEEEVSAGGWEEAQKAMARKRDEKVAAEAPSVKTPKKVKRGMKQQKRAEDKSEEEEGAEDDVMFAADGGEKNQVPVAVVDEAGEEAEEVEEEEEEVAQPRKKKKVVIQEDDEEDEGGGGVDGEEAAPMETDADSAAADDSTAL
jgi:tetratricopeptide (TPR) repeat protein